MKIDRPADVSVNPQASQTKLSGKADQASTSSSVASTSSSGSATSLSAEATFAQKAAVALEETTIPENDKVATLKAAIEQGKFSVDSKTLARSLAEHFASKS